MSETKLLQPDEIKTSIDLLEITLADGGVELLLVVVWQPGQGYGVSWGDVIEDPLRRSGLLHQLVSREQARATAQELEAHLRSKQRPPTLQEMHAQLAALAQKVKEAEAEAASTLAPGL